MVIPVFGLTWHIHQSPALYELLISPLSPYMQFKQLGWDGESELPGFESATLRNNPILFFQLPPPESIYNDSDLRLVWIPMWDQARGYNLEWWGRLPKKMRVVSFSNEISLRARAVGLKTLDVRYFISPAECGLADWDKPRTLLYWNRTGMVGQAFLHKLCNALDVEVLLFRQRIDPRVLSWCSYVLPEKLGNTVVKELRLAPEGVDAHRHYLQHLDQANIFVAPRLSEGVGLSFVEALARGCAVFAHDAPTMNEYITHKKNGFLLHHHHRSVFNSMRNQITKKAHRIARYLGYESLFFDYPVTARQNWSEIKKLDLQALGIQARQEQHEGYSLWKNILQQYASFILDWE